MKTDDNGIVDTSGEDQVGVAGPRGVGVGAKLHGHVRLLRPPKSEPDMIALIRHTVDSGVTFLDPSNIYGPHTNEILIGKALKGGLRERVQVTTKFGISPADGKGNRQVRGDPAYVRVPCEPSLKRLDIDCIDLYYQHRVDARVPVEVTIYPCPIL